jgi:hypothetical protein
MSSILARLVDAVKMDINFVRGHTLQPKWYKVLKVFLLLGFVVGYYLLFGPATTLVFFGVFFALCLVIHMTYRVKTHVWTQTWLDFVVIQEGNETRMGRIGKYYYSAVAVSALIALVASQVLVS